MELKKLKEKYLEIEKKHNLPKFNELDKDFEIGKLERESDFLVRSIRKIMMEKIVNSLNFLEMLINPGSAPRMYFTYIKTMSVEDKKIIEELYGSLSKLTLESLSLEIGTEEKDEAELIEKIFSEWKKLREKFKGIIKNIKKPGKTEGKKKREYFG